MNQDAVDTCVGWADHKEEICARIRKNRALLKIVLKTKDEVDFLRRWIDYHSNIVGPENLIIFDNGSTDPAVHDVYRQIADKTLVVKFSGFHNMMHRVHAFPELYASLQQSSSYFCFLDTDEFLIWAWPDGAFASDSKILSELDTASRSDVLPTLWLENVEGYDDRFWFDAEQNHLKTGLKGGKPIISSAANISGLINHNFQVSPDLFASSQTANFVVLHLKRLFPRQRIRINIQKLRQYHVLSDSEDVEKVLAMDPDKMQNGNPKTWVREIQRMWGKTEVTPDRDAPVRRGQLKLSRDESRISFFDSEQHKLFSDYLNDPSPLIKQVLGQRAETQ
jgi:hypothetical protein